MPRKRLFFRFADGGMQLSARFIACLSFLLRFAMFLPCLQARYRVSVIFAMRRQGSQKNELTYQA